MAPVPDESWVTVSDSVKTRRARPVRGGGAGGRRGVQRTKASRSTCRMGCTTQTRPEVVRPGHRPRWGGQGLGKRAARTCGGVAGGAGKIICVEGSKQGARSVEGNEASATRRSIPETPPQLATFPHLLPFSQADFSAVPLNESDQAVPGPSLCLKPTGDIFRVLCATGSEVGHELSSLALSAPRFPILRSLSLVQYACVTEPICLALAPGVADVDGAKCLSAGFANV